MSSIIIYLVETDPYSSAVTQSEAQQNNILAGSCVFWPLEDQKLSHVKLPWLKENGTNIEQKKTETLLSILPLQDHYGWRQYQYSHFVFYEFRLQAHVALFPMWPT